MGRLIDTSDLNNQIMLQKDRFGCLAVTISNVFEDIIRDTPTTNIDRSSGEWISLGDNNYECSECHEKCYFPKLRIANYCFFCGAKMVEPQESEG